MTAPDPGTLSEAGWRAWLNNHWWLGCDHEDCPRLTSFEVRHLAAIIAARLAAAPARDDLAAKVEALAEDLEAEGARAANRDRHDRGMRAGKRIAANRLRALLADPEPDQEQP